MTSLPVTVQPLPATSHGSLSPVQPPIPSAPILSDAENGLELSSESRRSNFKTKCMREAAYIACTKSIPWGVVGCITGACYIGTIGCAVGAFTGTWPSCLKVTAGFAGAGACGGSIMGCTLGCQEMRELADNS